MKEDIRDRLILGAQLLEASLEELNLKIKIRQVEGRIFSCLRDEKTGKDYLVVREDNNYKIVLMPKEAE